MFDDYQIPAMALIAALMLAFGYLHVRFRSVRTLLWLIALGCAEVQAVLVWLIANSPRVAHLGPSISIAAEVARLLSTALFLGSLSPRTFRIGRHDILYVIPYIVPVLIYGSLYYGISRHPAGPLLLLFWALALWTAVAAFLWGIRPGPVPIWINLVVILGVASACVPLLYRGDVHLPLLLGESSTMLITALLVLYTVKRISPGVILATCGFLAWAVPPYLIPQTPATPVLVAIILARTFVLGKVLVAMGLILLVLEDEVEKNQKAQQREREVRLELEAYARQSLTARSLEDFDRDSSQLCYMITEHSHFASASMIVRGSTGSYTLVGYAGMDGATAGALDAMVQRLPAASLTTGGTPLVAEVSSPGGSTQEGSTQEGSTQDGPSPEGSSIDLDFTPWLTPGDDLERLHLTRVLAVPMLGPDNSTEGALLLSGPRVPLESLRADDLLPLEILAGRLQSARAQALMLGKLIESERFAGVGQLATNVAQQLNNPLTVILGYSALLEDSVPASADRRAAEAIAAEARRMKSILDRLSRFSRLSNERFSSFSLADLILDIEQLHRTDFLRHSIEFRSSVAFDLPEIFGNPHQIRQALLHATQFAIDTVLRVAPSQEKSIRIEVSRPSVDEGHIEILIAHSGQGFPHPERAFDSLASGFSNTEATGIGLSLCAAIVREHRGTIRAINYQPTGAAIQIHLPIS
jgi:signal transduction histidine kinase